MIDRAFYSLIANFGDYLEQLLLLIPELVIINLLEFVLNGYRLEAFKNLID